MPALTWRLSFSGSTGGSYIQLTEVAFLDAAGDDLCVGGTPGANSYYGSGYDVGKAFDKNLGTDWCTAQRVFPAELWYTLPTPADVARIRIRFASSSNWLPTGLEAITLSGAGADGVYDPLVRYPLSIESGSIAANAEVVLAVGAKQTIRLRAEPEGVVFRPTPAGAGTVTVTTSRKGSPNKPLAALVTLFTLDRKRWVAQAWANAKGVAVFEGLDTQNTRYLAVAEYPENPSNPKAENYYRPQAGVSLLDGEVAL